MNVASRRREWDACGPTSSRDKGWSGVDVGALCLSSSSSRHSARYYHTSRKSFCHEDKHKAPTPPRICPLSLLDGATSLLCSVGKQHQDGRRISLIMLS